MTLTDLISKIALEYEGTKYYPILANIALMLSKYSPSILFDLAEKMKDSKNEDDIIALKIIDKIIKNL